MTFGTLSTSVLETSGVPRKFWKLNPKTYKGSPNALKRVNRFVKQQLESPSYPGLLLYGPPRTYKTFLATYMIKFFLVSGVTDCVYITFDRLTELYMEDSTGAFLQNFKGFSYVVIDNVFTPQGAAAEKNAFSRLVAYCSDQGISYSVVSDLTLEELSKQFPRVSAKLESDLIPVSTSCTTSAFEARILSEKEKERYA